MKHMFVLSLAIVATPIVSAQVPETFSFTPNQAIPDNLATGISDTRTISTGITALADLNVTLKITGDPGFNGDYYAYLSHGSDISVLINRVGKRTGSSLGYSDNGFNVKFDDQASQGEVHVYRFTLSGSHSVPIDATFQNPLTGTWAPDGRTANPSTVLDSDPRTASLSNFNGKNPNGDWTLFVSDFSAGSTGTLTSWGLELTPVPEPLTTFAFFGITGIGTVLIRRRLV